MKSFENIKTEINNTDLIVIRFVKSTVAWFIHWSQVGIKYILNNFNISGIINVYIRYCRPLLLKSWMQKDTKED